MWRGAPLAAGGRRLPGDPRAGGDRGLLRAGGPGRRPALERGDPADIPVVDGVRLLVLDEPSYARSWPAGRFFPGMRGDLILERALEPEETERWLARVSPAGELTG